MQKARGHPTWGLPPLVGNEFQILFHSPNRGTFHLSLTVLVHYRSIVVFSLTPWSAQIHTGFHVSGATQDTSRGSLDFEYRAITSMAALSRAVLLSARSHIESYNPAKINLDGLG